MEDKSQIIYWVGGDCILTVPTTKVPVAGEEIYINTLMNEDWYDSHFPNRSLFRKGVKGKFLVTSVDRYYKTYRYIQEEGGYDLPAEYVSEDFEVKLVQLD